MDIEIHLWKKRKSKNPYSHTDDPKVHWIIKKLLHIASCVNGTGHYTNISLSWRVRNEKKICHLFTFIQVHRNDVAVLVFNFFPPILLLSPARSEYFRFDCLLNSAKYSHWRRTINNITNAILSIYFLLFFIVFHSPIHFETFTYTGTHLVETNRCRSHEV